MKTTKTTFTIVSALASVILLTSCGSNTTKTKEANSTSSKNQVTLTYDQQRSGTKRLLKQRPCIYKDTMSLRTV